MEKFGCPKNIVGLVLPPVTASTSTARRCSSLASVFVAQLFGVPMTLPADDHDADADAHHKGVAGVRAALVVLTATLVQFKLPLEGAAILLAIDQIMDMGRTAVNVMGNCISTAVVARWKACSTRENEGVRRHEIEQ